MNLYRHLRAGGVSTALITTIEGGDTITFRLWSRVGTTQRSIKGFPAGTHGRLWLYFVIDMRKGDAYFEWGSDHLAYVRLDP